MSTIDPARVALAQSDYDDRKKSAGVAYAFWFFLGIVGGHRFYVGDIGRGIAMLLTFGGLVVWAVVDVFFIGGRVNELNHRTKREVFGSHGVPLHG